MFGTLDIRPPAAIREEQKKFLRLSLTQIGWMGVEWVIFAFADQRRANGTKTGGECEDSGFALILCPWMLGHKDSIYSKGVLDGGVELKWIGLSWVHGICPFGTGCWEGKETQPGRDRGGTKGYGVICTSRSNETRIWSNNNYLLFRAPPTIDSKKQINSYSTSNCPSARQGIAFCRKNGAEWGWGEGGGSGPSDKKRNKKKNTVKRSDIQTGGTILPLLNVAPLATFLLFSLLTLEEWQ